MAVPNIVLIITDDQPKGYLKAMPHVTNQIFKKGIDLTRGIAPTALCGPSRASTLTGLFNHEMGLWTNNGVIGGWPVFQAFEGATIATALQAAGYYTGLFGKYMNGWNEYSGVVPLGWNEFRAINPDDGGDGDYYNYTMRGIGASVHYGSGSADYSTDVIYGASEAFIRNAPAGQPILLYCASYGAHGPMVPAPRHKDTWADNVFLGPAVNENNVGKPRWVRQQPKVNEVFLRELTKSQGECCMSIDDGVGDLVQALIDTGRLSNTLFVYFGDNGYQMGDHRLMGKNVPYKASTNLQMALRWDGHYPAGATSSRITPTVDLTATIVEAAGAVLPTSGIAYPMPRIGVCLQGASDEDHPAYIGWRNERWMWVQWATGEEELYDYANDPSELRNVIGLAQHRDRVNTFRLNAQNTVIPRPIGWPA